MSGVYPERENRVEWGGQEKERDNVMKKKLLAVAVACALLIAVRYTRSAGETFNVKSGVDKSWQGIEVERDVLELSNTIKALIQDTGSEPGDDLPIFGVTPEVIELLISLMQKQKHLSDKKLDPFHVMLELTKHDIPNSQLKDVLYAANTQELPIIENALVLKMVEISEREATADTAERIGTYQTLVKKISGEHATFTEVIDAWYNILHSKRSEHAQEILQQPEKQLDQATKENYKNRIVNRMKEVIEKTNFEQLSNEQASNLTEQAPQFGSAIAKMYYLTHGEHLPNTLEFNYGFSIRELLRFGRLQQIRKNKRLGLQRRKINSLDGMELIPGIQNVEELYLNNNQLTSLQDMPQLPKLQFLFLDYNQLASLQHMPQNLPILYNLHLNNNQLTSLEGMPQNLPRLWDLTLNNNRLDNLQNIPPLPKLKELHLDDNQLTNLQGMPQNLPKLLFLYLRNNQLTSLEGLPQNLPNLRKLYLENNPAVNNPDEMAALRARFPNTIIITE